MEGTSIVGVVAICIAILVGAFFTIRARKQRPSRSADYEILLAELRRQADAQRELVEALTEAVCFAIRHKDSDINVLTDSMGLAARNELERENEKLKAQLAFIDEVMRKRDSEL